MDFTSQIITLDFAVCKRQKLFRSYNKNLERSTVIKGLKLPPLEPKSESCFSPISSDWFIRRVTQM